MAPPDGENRPGHLRREEGRIVGRDRSLRTRHAEYRVRPRVRTGRIFPGAPQRALAPVPTCPSCGSPFFSFTIPRFSVSDSPAAVTRAAPERASLTANSQPEEGPHAEPIGKSAAV